MKKYLMFIFVVFMSFLCVRSVNASSVTYDISNFYSYFDEHVETYQRYEDNINYLKSLWEENHSSDSPYYFIVARRLPSEINGELGWSYTLYSTDSYEFVLRSGFIHNNSDLSCSNSYCYEFYITSSDEFYNDYVYSVFSYPVNLWNNITAYIVDSNISPVFRYELYSYGQSGSTIIEDYNSIHLPSYNSDIYSLSIPEIEIRDKDVIPTLKSLINGSYVSGLTKDYTEVDLNNYSYVALSLKDYNVSSFDSIFYVKGQACPTVVYDYGLEEKPNTDRCNIAFDNFSPIRYRISDNDIENHFIYYFKAYDTSIENKIKVDSSLFNIHYITEEQKDNPILNINGKYYSSIPFDELSSTANKNEADNFVPGASEELSFEGFFDKPLETLKSVWDSILTIFSLIAEFILLLPPVMQSFLYLSFGIAIILGILKIIL